MITRLIFGKGNAKLAGEIATFSLPAGHTCPGALECLAKANRVTGKLLDGADSKFRCYAASMESRLPNVRHARWENYDVLRNRGEMAIAALILANLPKQNIVRVHVSGDFYSQAYFDAWLEVARRTPDKLFYAYTKCLTYWIRRKDLIPKNFRLIASKGGRYDDLIKEHNLRYAEVVYSEREARAKGLKIDHDDSIAYGTDKSFALMIHGNGPEGSLQAKAHYAVTKGVK